MVRSQFVRFVVGIAAAVALSAAAGCSKPIEPGGSVQETPDKGASSPPPSSAKTPSATPSDVPEEKGRTAKLDAATKAGVERVVRSYLNALNKAYKSGDTSAMKSLAHPKCSYCKNMVFFIEKAYGNGGRIEGSQAGAPRDVKVGDMLAVAGAHQIHYFSKVPWSAGKTLDKSGRTLQKNGAEVTPEEFTVERDREGKMTIRGWSSG